MIEYKSSEVSLDMLKENTSSMPWIVCSNMPRLFKKINEAGYKTVEINTELSKRLLLEEPNSRPNDAINVLNEITSWNEPVFVTDFEMLFDPRYKIDVLKFFCEKSRTINIAIKWPGKYTSNYLTYAKIDDSDYKEYYCDSYQIRILK